MKTTISKLIFLFIAAVLVFGGAALVLPTVATWPALQIQAGLGNPAPLQEGILKALVGLVAIFAGIAALKKTY